MLMSPKKEQLEELEEESPKSVKILDAAFDLFTQRGLEDVSMADIAAKAKVSEDLIYELFTTKQNLAVRTATQVWATRMESLFPTFLKPKFQSLKGIEQLHDILYLFIKLYEKETDFLRFIYLFDAYAVKEKIPKESMSVYEAKILLLKQIISDAIQKGISDGTINEKFLSYGDLLYFTLMHTFFSEAQKLSLSGKMLDMDSQLQGSVQLKLLADLLLASLK